MRDILNKLMEIDVSSKIRTIETITYDDVVWEVYTLFDRINEQSNGFKIPASISLTPDDIFILEHRIEVLYNGISELNKNNLQVYKLITRLKEYIIDEKYDFQD